MPESVPGLRILLNQSSNRALSHHFSSHYDRDRIIEVFGNVLSRTDPPENFALQAVQEALKPQKQTVLVLDENQSLESALRTLLQGLVSSAVQSGESIMQYGQSIGVVNNARGQIACLLDVVLYLCERGHIEGGMIFQLLEDLTEMSTIKDCKEVFGYIESKQDILGKQELFGRGKLVMLRTCNQLLRRLSKANDVVFCGRILMFLAHFFPLSERSAVNIKGVFNTSNDTKYEQDAPDGFAIDFNFYQTFWSLQEHFKNPASFSLAPSKWQKFASNLMIVLDTFEAQPLSEDDGNAHNLGQEEATFSIKYLTSSKLMGLELKDPSFRRHILLQCLIVFDYVKAPGKDDKDGPSDSMKEEIRSCEERVKKILENTPPKGKEFLKCIEHILEREKNWVWWKSDGCPAYEKHSTDGKNGSDVPKKRKPRWRLGNKELSQLWKWADQNPNALTDPQRTLVPSVREYWKALADDMDISAGIEADYHHKNNRVYCWKGLRFSAKQDLEGFSRFTDHGIEGVVPPELLPPEARARLHSKPSEKSKRTKKEPRTAPTVDGLASTPAAEADGCGSGADMEDSVAPEYPKPSPEMELGQSESGQIEAEVEGNAAASTTQVEQDMEVKEAQYLDDDVEPGQAEKE